MGSELRLAAFDFDGTLIDSAQSIVEGVIACWAHCRFPEPDPVAVRRIIGLPWEEGIQALMPGSGAAEVAMVHDYHLRVSRGELTRPPRSETLFAGALETLDRLAAEDYVLAIVTSRSNRRLQELLEELGIRDRFATVKTVDHGPGKPNPFLLLQAMQETGVAPGNAVMIGDTTFDILMARNAGTSAIGVSWGVHEVDELHAAGAHRVVEAFDHLPPTIGTLLGRTSLEPA
ncbi:MAG: HAD-IA family hydrolase [Rhodospirillales bacterium]